MSCYDDSLLLVGNSLEPQEFLDSPVAVESSPTTQLRPAVRQIRLVVNRHSINVNSPRSLSVRGNLSLARKPNLPAFNLPSNPDTPRQVLGEHSAR